MATEALLTDLGQGSQADSGAADQGAGDAFEQQGDSGEGDGPDDQSQDGSQRQGERQEGGKLDGRRGPQNIRESIKAASEQFPERAQQFRELGNAYFREQAYKAVFPTVQEATGAKNLIESVGGVDGITQMQERDAMYTQQDDFLRDGNPDVLDDFFEDFPEGAAALAPHYLERLAKASPEAFSNAVVPYTVQMLEGAGFADYLRAIAGQEKIENAKALAQRLLQWFDQQKQGVASLRTQATDKNPASERLTRRETELQQREEKQFKTQTDSLITSKVTPKLDAIVEQVAKRNRWNDEQKGEFRTRLLQDVAAQMDKDESYKKQAGLRYSNKKRTHESVASYIASEFIRRMNDKDGALATETRVKKLFGQGGAVQRQHSASQNNGQRSDATPPPAGVVRVAQAPADNQIDWNHKDAETWFLIDKARLRDGRVVSWAKPR